MKIEKLDKSCNTELITNYDLIALIDSWNDNYLKAQCKSNKIVSNLKWKIETKRANAERIRSADKSVLQAQIKT